MNIISKRTLVQFYEKYPQAKTPLEVWYQDTKKAQWKTPSDIKKVYSNASFLEDNRVVFNIKGNAYRLVVHVDYLRKIVRVKFISTIYLTNQPTTALTLFFLQNIYILILYYKLLSLYFFLYVPNKIL